MFQCFIIANGTRCLQCGSTWFCSQECRNCSKGSYHSVECGLLPLLYSIGIAHLGFRIIVSAGLQELLDFHKNIEANSKIPGVHAPYSRHDYLVLFHLVSHTETIPTEELYHYSLVRINDTILKLVWLHFTTLSV